jgi:6-phosphofructokinase 1
MTAAFQRVGVLTSGGDAPGMNSAVRAVARTALSNGIPVMGIRRGYAGLIENDLFELKWQDVGGIIQRGGTVLQTARSKEFLTEAGQRQAVRNLNARGIEGLVVIGGDGSMRGALELEKKGIPVVALPGTIDNDLPGTDMSIGVDTALNTIVRCIDAIKDTASSHRRAIIIETMGRHSGYLALMGGLACGAELTLIPEAPFTPEEVAEGIQRAYDAGKSHCIIVVAEGAQHNGAAIKAYLDDRDAQPDARRFGARLSVLGYIQRGGAPTAFDRTLATRLGVAATEALLDGQSGLMAGLQVAQGGICLTPIEEVVSSRPALDMSLHRIAHRLA